MSYKIEKDKENEDFILSSNNQYIDRGTMPEMVELMNNLSEMEIGQEEMHEDMEQELRDSLKGTKFESNIETLIMSIAPELDRCVDVLERVKEGTFFEGFSRRELMKYAISRIIKNMDERLQVMEIDENIASNADIQLN